MDKHHSMKWLRRGSLKVSNIDQTFQLKLCTLFIILIYKNIMVVQFVAVQQNLCILTLKFTLFWENHD